MQLPKQVDNNYRLPWEKDRPVRILLFTTHSSISSLYEVIQAYGNGEVIGVVYPRNRKDTEKIRDVLAWAQEVGIPVFEQPYAKDLSYFEQKLAATRPDIGISWSYSQIIQSSTLQVFPCGIWNMHGGKIPEYRGANVLNWAVANGENEIGVTWHIMEAQVDAGPILGQMTFPLYGHETALDARRKIFETGLFLFKKLWNTLADGPIPLAFPDLRAGTCYPPRKPLDSLITLELTRRQVSDLCRAQCDPWPPAILLHEDHLWAVSSMAEPDADASFVEYQALDGIIKLCLTERLEDETLRNDVLVKLAQYT